MKKRNIQQLYWILKNKQNGIINENNQISEGLKANITLFSTDDEWIFTEENILSKSKNSAFLGQKMKGKVIGIYNQNQLILS